MLLLSLQSSSLRSTLIIVPGRLLVVYSCLRLTNFSGLLTIIYIIVFIGGLLIFLISVASILPQEVNIILNIRIILITLIITRPFIVERKILRLRSPLVMPSLWIIYQRDYVIILVAILLLALIIITSLFLRFKGLIRSL